MDTPLALITYIVTSAVVAVVLLIAAPVFLLDYGLAIAWMWISVLAGWMLIEALHADFENEQETKRRALHSDLSSLFLPTVVILTGDIEDGKRKESETRTRINIKVPNVLQADRDRARHRDLSIGQARYS